MSVPLLTIVAPAIRGDIHRAQRTTSEWWERKTTCCGRNVAGWLTLDPQTLEQFMASAYSCSRCKKDLNR